MQTKDIENHPIDNSHNGIEDLNNNHQIQNNIPAFLMMIIGVFSMFPCFMLSYTFSSMLTLYTPHVDKVESLFLGLISVGILYLIACIISSFLWLKGNYWSRYPIIILAVIPTVGLLFFFSEQTLFWIVVGVVIDALLIKIMFFDPKRKQDKTIDIEIVA